MILSESIEDYLKAIYALNKEVGKVVTTQLTECLEVKLALGPVWSTNWLI